MTGMPDQQPAPDRQPIVCPWCSAALPADSVATCPSCAATLISTAEAQVPGVTAVDAQHLTLRRSVSPTKNRLLAWISGDSTAQSQQSAATPDAFVPPSADVVREMLRLELDAELTNRTAEVEAIRAEAALSDEAPDARGNQPPASDPS